MVTAGAILLAIPLLCPFVAMAIDEGLAFAAIVFAGVAVLGALTFAGIVLISKGFDP